MLQLPKLPTWTDAGSVSAFLLAAIGVVVALVRSFDPAFHAPAVVAAAVPVAGLVVAFLAVAVNVYTHRKAHSVVQAAISAAQSPAGHLDLEALAPKVAALIDTSTLAEDLKPFLSLLVTSQLGSQSSSSAPVASPAPASSPAPHGEIIGTPPSA